MRVPKPWIPVISEDIIDTLLKRELITLLTDKSTVLKAAQEIMIHELMVEDRLNEEVRQILKQYEANIDRERLDYRSLFDLTKKKLVKERNIIL